MRQTIWNQFHHLEDVSNMIFALAALDLPEVYKEGVQVGTGWVLNMNWGA
jgi:hypothetical protein